MSEPPLDADPGASGAVEARRLWRPAPKPGSLRRSPILCRGEGCPANWACWGRGLLGLVLGPNQKVWPE
eukprot:4276012-Alexandrium_andersonii.AAC.1